MRDVITWFCQKKSRHVHVCWNWKEQIFEIRLRRGPNTRHSKHEKHPIYGFIQTKTLPFLETSGGKYLSLFKGLLVGTTEVPEYGLL